MKRLLLLMLTLAMAPAALAHHSFAVHFVGDRTIKVTGVVDVFHFTNPHGILEFTVTDDKGAKVKWRAETNSPNSLRRRGWAKDSLKPGDQITIEGFPGRDEPNYMRISHVWLADGKELSAQAKSDDVEPEAKDK